MAFVPDKPLRFVPDKPAEPDTADKIANATGGYVDPKASLETAKGFGDVVGTGVLNIPHAAGAGLVDIWHRMTGNADAPAPDWLNALQAHLGQHGQKFANDVGQISNDTGVSDVAKAASDKLQDDNSMVGALTRSGLHVMGDVASLVPATSLATSAGSTVARNLASGAVRDTAADAAAEAAGYRNGTGVTGQAGKALAGSTAKPALVNHNADIAAVHARAESGIAHGQPLNYENFHAGREAPNSVYDRAAANLQTGPLDAQARTAIGQAGTPQGGRITPGTPQAQQQIEALRARLMDESGNFTGQQQINEMRGLRQEGFTNVGSDDVSNQQLGRAQLDMARAVEGHVGRNLPPNGPVSLEQFQAARKALAKNYTWQSALRGNDVDLNALARTQRADPELLDGTTKTAADFANSNREVVGLPTRVGAPNAVRDLEGTLSLLHPVQSTVTGLGGGMLGRQLLRGGSTLSQVERLQRMFPNQAGRFGPLPPRDLPGPGGGPVNMPPQAPPGLSLAPESAPPAAGGPPGQIPLADVLSHGVEQSPSPGLTVGPMGAPPQGGLPFHLDAAHAAGDLSLAPEDAWFHPGQGGVGDELAHVMSQGVPEGIAARTPSRRFVGQTVDYPAGVERRRIIENNGSAPGAAGADSLEAGARIAAEKTAGNAPFSLDADSTPHPMAHTVDAVDAAPPKGHVKVQIDSSDGNLKIVDRGGLSRGAALARIARYTALHGPVGDNFTPGE